MPWYIYLPVAHHRVALPVMVGLGFVVGQLSGKDSPSKKKDRRDTPISVKCSCSRMPAILISGLFIYAFPGGRAVYIQYAANG